MMNKTNHGFAVAVLLGSVLWSAAVPAGAADADSIRQHPMDTETMEPAAKHAGHKHSRGKQQDAGTIREHPMNTEETMVEQPVKNHGRAPANTSITEHPIEE